MANPDWTRDEVILALDLYFRAGKRQLPSTDAEVIRLSDLLRRLPFHATDERSESFRNPTGISMILGNFLGVDPAYPGKGLRRHNQLQEQVWKDFAENPALLHRTAEAIVHELKQMSQPAQALQHCIDEDVFPEGMLLTRLHLARERSRAAVARKKRAVLNQTGRLECEACGFDFAQTYGTLGEGFTECHHSLPLADLPFARQTRLTDLVIVCANCHRMLHRARPALSVNELRDLLSAGVRRDPDLAKEHSCQTPRNTHTTTL